LGLLGSRDSLKCCEFSKNSKKSFFRYFPGLLGSRNSLKDFSWACWGPGTA
ncbi:hypothetical protein T11_6734, partial [Trichinella zimbabwensis]